MTVSADAARFHVRRLVMWQKLQANGPKSVFRLRHLQQNMSQHVVLITRDIMLLTQPLQMFDMLEYIAKIHQGWLMCSVWDTFMWWYGKLCLHTEVWWLSKGTFYQELNDSQTLSASSGTKTFWWTTRLAFWLKILSMDGFSCEERIETWKVDLLPVQAASSISYQRCWC